MSSSSSNDPGVPVSLLHEAEGNNVVVELKNGEIYRGLLEEAEDTMNCRLKEGKHICFAIYHNFTLACSC